MKKEDIQTMDDLVKYINESDPEEEIRLTITIEPEGQSHDI